MKKFVTNIAIFLGVLTPHDPAQAQSAIQTFRDWSVVCNNVKTCMAFSTSSNSEGNLAVRPRGVSDDVSEGWMTIERPAGPNSVPTILLSRPDLAQARLPPDAQIQLVGGNGRPVARGTFAATLGSRGAIEIAPSVSSQFLIAARSATHAIFVTGPVKRKVFYVSLSGLVASGRNIDARQGRTGTTDALIDVGRARASINAAPTLPVLTALPFSLRPRAQPPAAIMNLRSRDCGDAERYDKGGTNIEAFNLNGGRTLWSVPCGAGAYNQWNQFYVQQPRAPIVSVSFTGRPQADGTEANVTIINPSINAAQGEIRAFYKGRGLGDCGSAETYVWTGNQFALAQMKEMLPCGGIVSDFWPSVVAHEVRLRPAR